MIQNPFVKPLAREALKQAARSAATAGAVALLQRLAAAVPGTPGLLLKGTVTTAGLVVGYFSRQ